MSATIIGDLHMSIATLDWFSLGSKDKSLALGQSSCEDGNSQLARGPSAWHLEEAPEVDSDD